MKKGLQYAFLASFLISACQPAADKKTNRSEEIAAQLPAQKNLPAYFNQVLQAHGGQQNGISWGPCNTRLPGTVIPKSIL